MKPFLLSMILTVLTCSTSLAQPELIPVSQLPKNVHTIDGQLSLHVDWEVDENNAVTAYLINRTSKPIQLSYAYQNTYLKLEAKNSDGAWQRAEVHFDEMCGTGLGQFELPPNEAVSQKRQLVHGAAKPVKIDIKAVEQEIQQIRDLLRRARLTKPAYDQKMERIAELESELAKVQRQGGSQDLVERKIRLSLYDLNARVNSNEGQGWVSLDAIEKSKRDCFSIRFASIEKLRAIIVGDEVIEPLETPMIEMDPRHTAIYALGRNGHSKEEVTAILDWVAKNETDPTIVQIAKNKQDQLGDDQ